jgi:hypothetical protein
MGADERPSSECDDDGGVMGSAGIGIEGVVASRAWRDRHELKMLPIACWLDSCGGLAGGEANSAACSRVKGGCAESQVIADGSSMFSQCNALVFLALPESRDGGKKSRALSLSSRGSSTEKGWPYI